MNLETLALVEIENADEVLTAFGEASQAQFLAAFEDRVRQLARPCDKIIKMQPNKLCVLLRGIHDPLQIQLAGAKLTRLFEPPISILDEEVKVTVHAAFVPPAEDCRDTTTRLRLAETSLREARRSGEPFVIRDAAVGATPTAIAMKRAREVEVAFERGDLVMYFQSQVNAGSRNVVAAEGLMRWDDPEKGVRPPGDFLPFVKSLDLMRSLTWFALKSSVSQCAAWPEHISVAVNISPRVLLDTELVPHVQDALAIFGLAPERLTLEITEDAVIEEPDQALAMLNELRATGVKVSMDDFGIGYSSLAYFRDLPVDELKVDRSFVSNMLERPKDRKIVKAIIDLAHNFSMRVVAEGVEDNETADALQELGADLLQGYWFSKPVREAEFRKLL
jgi:EAL domain-containing protein (putative c-di-GMP-specific phosphodiesterase class I)